MQLNEIRTIVEPYIGKLSAFQTAEDIREFLKVEGILAEERRPMHCAIAQYIHKETGQMVRVCRTETKAPCEDGTEPLIYFPTDSDFPKIAQFAEVGKHTSAMTTFIDNFDDGYYPDLVK
jgi:hypothetical protein